MKHAHIRKTSIAIGVGLALDIWSKIITHNVHTTLINGITNPEGAWNMPLSASILAVIGVAVLIGIGWLYRKRTIPTRSFVLLTAGALGNLYDRIFLHSVRDRLMIPYIPTCNLADIMITIGAI
ncbi:MAG: signal peptidase II [bacterium]